MEKRETKPNQNFWYQKMHSKHVDGVLIDELPEKIEYLTPESEEIAVLSNYIFN